MPASKASQAAKVANNNRVPTAEGAGRLGTCVVLECERPASWRNFASLRLPTKLKHECTPEGGYSGPLKVCRYHYNSDNKRCSSRKNGQARPKTAAAARSHRKGAKTSGKTAKTVKAPAVKAEDIDPEVMAAAHAQVAAQAKAQLAVQQRAAQRAWGRYYGLVPADQASVSQASRATLEAHAAAAGGRHDMDLGFQLKSPIVVGSNYSSAKFGSGFAASLDELDAIVRQDRARLAMMTGHGSLSSSSPDSEGFDELYSMVDTPSKAKEPLFSSDSGIMPMA